MSWAVRASSSQTALASKSRNGRLARPQSLAARMRSSTRARARWRRSNGPRPASRDPARRRVFGASHRPRGSDTERVCRSSAALLDGVGVVLTARREGGMVGLERAFEYGERPAQQFDRLVVALLRLGVPPVRWTLGVSCSQSLI